jgi:4-diphosphocytidyl-2-C-methyl-D-erythritol kinase
MHVRAHAKVNLTLEITGRRPDGYHDLRSVFLRIGLADELTVGAAPAGVDMLTVAGQPACPIADNLVMRAFAVARGALGEDLLPLAAHLEKRIPMAAGLGGGSSDAAAAIDAALAVWGRELAADDLARIALELGSDVPFFTTRAPLALVEGRGERIEPLAPLRDEPGLLLATRNSPLSSAEAFALYDTKARLARTENVSASLAIAVGDGLTGAALAGWADRLRDANDLWPAARQLLPELAAARAELERMTSRPWLLSGSGPTLFAFYPSPDEAHAAGVDVVTAASARLDGVTFHAVDLTGPEPIWRYP